MENRVTGQQSEQVVDRVYQTILHSDRPYSHIFEIMEGSQIKDPDLLFRILKGLQNAGYIKIEYVFEDEDGSYIGDPAPLESLPEQVQDSFLEQKCTRNMRPHPVVLR